MTAVRTLVTACGLVLVWHLIAVVTDAPAFILPTPLAVAVSAVERPGLLLQHAWVTYLEILLGLAIATVLGTLSALLLALYRPAKRWLLPVLVISQALPVFALAPILVLWLGYGIASKVAMAVMIIYFPVTAAFYDGLRRTDPGWLDLARTMGGSRTAVLRHIRIPAAMPAFASGLRVGTAVAPIGAVVGEWVGSLAGLGYLMLHANARMQVDYMFAALFLLAAFGVALYFTVDALLRRVTRWQREQSPFEDEES